MAVTVRSTGPDAASSIEIARMLTTGCIRSTARRSMASAGSMSRRVAGRGTKVPVPIYRVTRDGVREPVAVEIANPTSLALGPDGAMYVSSRFEGTVYRLTTDDQVEVYATRARRTDRAGVRRETGRSMSAIVPGRSFVCRRPTGRDVCDAPGERRGVSPRVRTGRLSVRDGADAGVARCDLSHHARSTRGRRSARVSDGRRAWRSIRMATCTWPTPLAGAAGLYRVDSGTTARLARAELVAAVPRSSASRSIPTAAW